VLFICLSAVYGVDLGDLKSRAPGVEDGAKRKQHYATTSLDVDFSDPAWTEAEQQLFRDHLRRRLEAHIRHSTPQAAVDSELADYAPVLRERSPRWPANWPRDYSDARALLWQLYNLGSETYLTYKQCPCGSIFRWVWWVFEQLRAAVPTPVSVSTHIYWLMTQHLMILDGC
jgi:hypothetical protein